MAKKKSKKRVGNKGDGVTIALSGLSINNNPEPTNRDIVTEFAIYFGSVSNLANWQRLCRDLGIDDELPSVRQCRLALKDTWINIYDFIDAKQDGVMVRKFESQRALANYTKETGRIYPKKKAKKGGPVRALLAHIFN